MEFYDTKVGQIYLSRFSTLSSEYLLLEAFKKKKKSEILTRLFPRDEIDGRLEACRNNILAKNFERLHFAALQGDS